MSDPDLTILRNQVAYHTEFAEQTKEVLGEFMARAIEAQTRLKLTSGGLQTAQSQAANAQEAHAQLQRKLDETRAELDATLSNKVAFETQNNDLRNELEKLTLKKSELTEQRQKLQEELAKEKTENSRLQAIIDEMNSGDLDGGEHTQT